MSNQVSGKIEGIPVVKQVLIKNGPKAGQQSNIYGVVLSGVTYEAGFKKPEGFEVGDDATITWETKYGKPAITHIVPGIQAASTGAAPPPPAGGGRFRPFPIPADHGDRSIIRQNSVTNAREFVSKFYTNADEAVTELFRLADLFEMYSSGESTALEIVANYTTETTEPAPTQPSKPTATRRRRTTTPAS